MDIKLQRVHEVWLKQQIESGRFSSLDDAVAGALDELLASTEQTADQLTWAPSDVAEGLVELDRGEWVAPD